jgi:hypothetical protein
MAVRPKYHPSNHEALPLPRTGAGHPKVKFSERTNDDQLRQPVFLGLRTPFLVSGLLDTPWIAEAGWSFPSGRFQLACAYPVVSAKPKG